MQLIEVPAKAGYVWFRQGIWLFRRNPLAFITLFFTYLLAITLVFNVPVHVEVDVVEAEPLDRLHRAGLFDAARDHAEACGVERDGGCGAQEGEIAELR